MGFDSHIIYILYGICIPEKEIEEIKLKLNITTIRPKQRKFFIANTSYFLIDYGDYWYLALKSNSYGVGENDEPLQHPLIISKPTEDEIITFKAFLAEHDLNYPYYDYFL